MQEYLAMLLAPGLSSTQRKAFRKLEFQLLAKLLEQDEKDRLPWHDSSGEPLEDDQAATLMFWSMTITLQSLNLEVRIPGD